MEKMQALIDCLHAYLTYSKSWVLKLADLDYLLTSTVLNTNSPFPEYIKQFKQIRCTYIFTTICMSDF